MADTKEHAFDEIIQELRRPFPPQLVKYRVGTADKYNVGPNKPAEWAMCLAYVDARDVMERLNLVCGMNWTDEYREIYVGEKNELLGVEASITILVDPSLGQRETRRDVGSLGNVQGGGSGDHGYKALWSDAFKRAAVKWGIGVALYFHPKSIASANNGDLVHKKDGTIKKISESGEKKFRDAYTNMIAGDEWGEVL